jgi:hypothetical protein
MKTKMVVLVAIVFLVSLIGCTQPSSGSGSMSGQAAPIDPICSPVRIAMMLDKSGSSLKTRTPLMTEEDANLVFDVLSKCGGEFAVGMITDDSNRSLLRVRIDTPPVKPTAPIGDGNPFAAAIKAGEFEKQKQSYDNQLAVWKEAMEKRLQSFRQELTVLVTAASNAPKTDIWGAVGRIELFLGEDESSWEASTKKFGILVSDCEDNVHRKAVTPKSEAAWIVVNGTPVPLLPSLSPVRFESIAASVRHIAAK